jgi:O-antigen/teichoic acid export membrane protein
MRVRANATVFLLDQAVSSALTFIVLTTVARISGPAEIGKVALIQSAALIALASGRALGLDVWASRGATVDERRSALASSMMFIPLPLIVGLGIALLSGFDSPVTIIYLVTAPIAVALDSVRILLLHRFGSWVSLVGQSLTLVAAFVSGYVYSDVVATISIYGIGITAVVVFGLIYVNVLPAIPSPHYCRLHSNRSVPFVGEVLLGSVSQQILFFLLAILSSVETVGIIRTAQTLLGPISLIFSGISPILLRRLGNGGDGEFQTARLGLKSGLLLAGVSFAGVVVMSTALSIRIGGKSVLSTFIGDSYGDISLVVLFCGLALSLNGILLGVGTALRVLDLTGRLNKLRVILVPFQMILVGIAGLVGSVYIAAGSLALSALFGAGAALFVVYRFVRVGRGRESIEFK